MTARSCSPGRATTSSPSTSPLADPPHDPARSPRSPRNALSSGRPLRMTDAAALPGQPRGGVLSGLATPRAVNVLAPNPSAMTLDGTNTWILAEPDSDLAVVVDPGPLDEGHLRNIVAMAEKSGKRGALTLHTHDHPDHAAGRARLPEP